MFRRATLLRETMRETHPYPSWLRHCMSKVVSTSASEHRADVRATVPAVQVRGECSFGARRDSMLAQLGRRRRRRRRYCASVASFECTQSLIYERFTLGRAVVSNVLKGLVDLAHHSVLTNDVDRDIVALPELSAEDALLEVVRHGVLFLWGRLVPPFPKDSGPLRAANLHHGAALHPCTL